MADEDFTGNGGDGSHDVCSFFASFINQRRSVERLINWLRESQTTCTDSNCFEDINGFPGTEYGRQVDTTANDYGDPQQAEPFALVMLFAIGLLTLFTLSLGRERRLTTDAVGNSKRNRSSRDYDHDGDGNNHGNRDDDNTRPAI